MSYREAKPGTFGRAEWLDLLMACQAGEVTCQRVMEIMGRELADPAWVSVTTHQEAIDRAEKAEARVSEAHDLLEDICHCYANRCEGLMELMFRADRLLGRKSKHKAKGVPAMSSAETCLQEAQRLVGGDRNASYGHPRPDFERVARLWAAILEVETITAEQVGLCMIALKMARLMHKYKRDSVVDIAGYALCLELIAKDKADPKI